MKTFALNRKQVIAANKWIKTHVCTNYVREVSEDKETWAEITINDMILNKPSYFLSFKYKRVRCAPKIVYQFSETGIDLVAKVLCTCGKQLGITDYGTW